MGQTKFNTEKSRKQAISFLSSHKGYHLDLISMALRGKKVSFEKVIKMIDDMVALLGKDQADDDKQKVFCEDELEKATDEESVAKDKKAQLEASIDEATDG